MVLNKLLAAPLIDEVIVNTDSEKIIESLQNHFPTVKIHVRPEEIRGDYVSMNKIIHYDIENSDADIYLQTHSTNPLIRTESINDALAKFKQYHSSCDSIFSVTKLQTRLYFEDGKPINHNPQELIRTQDLPPVFEENSCFFIFTKESFYQSGMKRIGKKPKMFEINKLEAVDIDEKEDFIIAESLYKLLN